MYVHQRVFVCVCSCLPGTYCTVQVITLLCTTLGCTAQVAAVMAERVDKYGRCVIYQGPLAQCMQYKQIMTRTSTLVTVALDLAVYLTQQAAVSGLLWLDEMAKMSDGFRRVICAVMAGQRTMYAPLDVDQVPAPGSSLRSLLLHYSTLWHYPRRAAHALLVTLLRESDFKIVLSRCFVQVWMGCVKRGGLRA